MSVNADNYGYPHASAGAGSSDRDDRPAAVPSGRGERSDDSPAAARLLEMTARDTDKWRAEARIEAAAIVADARKEAAQLVRAAREEADRLVTAAREQAAETTNDARVEAYWVRQETTALRTRHDEEVARLQQVESEHRERLRDHLTGMLERVDAAPGQRDE